MNYPPRTSIARFLPYLLSCLLCLPSLSLQATTSPPHDRKLIISKEGNKFGLVSRKGKTILSPRYDSLGYTDGAELYVAYLLNEAGLPLAGLITEKGKELIHISFQGIKQLAADRFMVVNVKERAALFNAEGERKTDFVFDTITAFKGQLARFYQGGKAGVLDRDGRIRLAASFQDVLIRSDQLVDVIELREWEVRDSQNQLQCRINLEKIQPLDTNLWLVSTRFYDASGKAREAISLSDASGKLLQPYRQFQVISVQENLIKHRQGQHTGVISREGRSLLAPEFDSVSVLPKLILAGKRLNQGWEWKAYSHQGRLLSRETYEKIIPVADELLPARREGRWGYIDTRGQELLVCRYDSTLAFEGKYARVRYDGSEGIIGRDGRWVLSPTANFIRILPQGHFIVHEDERQLLKDSTAQTLFTSQGSLHLMANGLLREHTPQRLQGIINLQGKRLIASDYQSIKILPATNSGMLQPAAPVYLAEKYGQQGILHPNGRFIASGPQTFDQLYGYSEEFLPIRIGQKYGFVDVNGKLRISNRYDSVTYFSEGLAAVSLLNRWGYVDKIERLRIQPNFDTAGPFIDGLAIVGKGSQQTLITKSGEQLLPAWYDRIEPLSSGRYLLHERGRVGLTDKEGRLILQPKYNSIRYLPNGFLLVEREGKFGLMTRDGVSTIPMIFNSIQYDALNKLFLCAKEQPAIRRIELSAEK